MMTTRAVLLAMEKIKAKTAMRKRWKAQRKHTAFLEHIKTCKVCALKWKAQHGGVSKEEVEAVTGIKTPVHDTGVVAPAKKQYLN